jgi:hypothetical protein
VIKVATTGEIIAKLSMAEQRLEQALTKASSAAEDANAARSLVAGTLEGSSAGPLISRIDKVRELLHEAGNATGPARSGLRDTITRVQALGN